MRIAFALMFISVFTACEKKEVAVIQQQQQFEEILPDNKTTINAQWLSEIVHENNNALIKCKAPGDDCRRKSTAYRVSDITVLETASGRTLYGVTYEDSEAIDTLDVED